MFTSDYAAPEAQSADARYIISQAPLADPALKPILQDGALFLYENPQALARARLSNGRPTGLVNDEAPTRVYLEVGQPGAKDVVLADQWYPGWVARGGYRRWDEARPVAITLSRGMFRQVTLAPTDAPPLKNAVIEMRYLPTAFRVGLYGLCLALAVALGIVAAELFQKLGRRRGG